MTLRFPIRVWDTSLYTGETHYVTLRFLGRVRDMSLPCRDTCLGLCQGTVKLHNGFLQLSCDTSWGTQQTHPFSKGNDYSLTLYKTIRKDLSLKFSAQLTVPLYCLHFGDKICHHGLKMCDFAVWPNISEYILSHHVVTEMIL